MPDGAGGDSLLILKDATVKVPPSVLSLPLT